MTFQPIYNRHKTLPSSSAALSSAAEQPARLHGAQFGVVQAERVVVVREPGGWHSRCVVSTSGAGRSTTPESVGYSLKRLVLGKPLITEQLKSERLSNPVALGVLSPDAISSSAYGTEEILIELLPYAGLAAFTLVLPITG